MAYNGNFLSRIAQTIEGNQGEFFYVSPDGIATVFSAGYFSDGAARGMEQGDIVNIVAGGVTYQAYVTNSPTSTSRAATVAPFFGAQAGYLSSNFRNLLDGGDATINPWQRGNFFSNIGTTAVYTADRWFLIAGAAATSATVSNVATTSVPTFSQAFQWGRGTSGTTVSTITFGQVLESLDSIRMQGSPVTLSFWAAANTGFSGANMGVTLAMGSGTNQSATSAVAGTWTGYNNVISATQALTSTPTRYSFYGTVPTSATQLAALFSYSPTNSNAVVGDNIYMWGVQLEAGTGPTAFEHRDVQVELEICQRYFFQINEGTSGSIVGSGEVITTNNETIFIPLPVQMRSPPTVTVLAGSFALYVIGTTAAVSGFAAGSTHTVNFINVVSTTTAASGQAALLVSRQPNSGFIQATADL
jgi:hypothetical protein